MGEAFIMAEIEIGLGAVVGDKNLSMLEGGHGAWVDVEVRVKLHQIDFEPATLQQAADGGGR